MIESVSNSDIYTIDADYFRPNLASVHLIKQGNRVALIDTGTSHSVANIQTALSQLGLDFSHVDYIILTHIHLDHAGGAGKLMQLCENAQLVVHARGARHMAEPQKLIAGTIAVYGEAEYKRLYDEILPIKAERIIQPADGESLYLNNRELTFIDTPGHANHHHCIIDHQSKAVFTGDTAGVGYQALRNPDKAQEFVFITSTPVQFNPEAMHQSIDRIMSFEPKHLYLTHYGAVTPSNSMIASLHEQIDTYVMLTEKITQQSEHPEHALTEALIDYVSRSAHTQVQGLDDETVRDWVKMDSKLSAQGLLVWHQRHTNKPD